MTQARFSVGAVVHHRMFDYRGVIIDVDPCFCGSDEWYEEVARTRPPKDAPWYHVLVHGALHRAYVAERNLEPDHSSEPIRHPLIDQYFSGIDHGVYVPKAKSN